MNRFDWQSITFFVIWFYFLTPVSAQDACWNHDLIKKPQTPSCAKSSEIFFPDASQPTAGVFISYVPSSNEEVLVKTYDLLKKYAPDTKLNILISKYGHDYEERDYTKHCSQLSKNETDKKFICRIKNVLADKQTVNVVTMSTTEDRLYTQDYLQFGIRNNQPILYPAVNLFETIDSGPDANKSFVQDDVANQCGFANLKLPLMNVKGSTETMGGNIETIPGGKVIIGKRSQTDAYDMNDQIVSTVLAQEELISEKISDPIYIDATYAPVGHADEMFSVVRSNAKCGFSVLIPSPELAMSLMKRSTTPENKEKCISQSKYGRPNFEGANSKQLAQHSASGCVGFGGITYSEFLKDADSLQLNHKFEQSSKNNEVLLSKFFRKDGCENPDFIRLPYLIKTSSEIHPGSLIPNPVNALVISPVSRRPSIYINNPTFVSVFDTYISKVLTSRGLIISTVTTADYFSGVGGLHCGSSTIQICRQK